MLYRAFPEADEGQLSRRLADLVRRETCAEVALAWDVEPYIRLGAGEKGSATLKQAILGDICESIIGAVFLDGGYDAAIDLVQPRFRGTHAQTRPSLARSENHVAGVGAGAWLPPPVYRELARSGRIMRRNLPSLSTSPGYGPQEAKGPSKRLAEQGAATAFIKREKIAPPA